MNKTRKHVIDEEMRALRQRYGRPLQGAIPERRSPQLVLLDLRPQRARVAVPGDILDAEPDPK